jgi:hypothetical protein
MNDGHLQERGSTSHPQHWLPLAAYGVGMH